MPFGRTHARTKSRSPALNSGSPSMFTPRPPAFLPPSHYAAAAGLPYPPKPSRETHQDGPSYPTQTPTDDTPLVQSSESQSSHSSTMGRLMRRVSSKRFTVNLSRPEKEKDGWDNRKSQLVDIPLLEMQLIPSLRDTVDRMTHPPQPDSGESMDTHPTSSSHLGTSPLHLTTTGIPVPSPRPKSALKSPARRTNTPASSVSRLQTPVMLIRDRGDYLDSSRVSDSTQSDLRVDRFRPGKQYNQSPLPIPTTKQPSALQALRAKAKTRSNPSTPQQNRRNSVFATPQPARPPASPLPSTSLPRPKVARFTKDPVSDSGSELEREVDKTLSPGRLVVANAVVVPSSSESEESMSSGRRSRWTQIPQRSQLPVLPPAEKSRDRLRQASRIPLHRKGIMPSRMRSRGSVGLGLNVNGVDVGGRRTIESLDSEDEAIYNKLPDTSLMDEPVIFPTTEEDNGSIYDYDPPPQFGDPRRRPGSVHQANDARRQETLMGLVEGFHRDYRRSADAMTSMVQSDSGADHNVQGLAISDSTSPLDHVSHRNSGDTQNERHNTWEQDSTYSDEDVRETRPIEHTVRFVELEHNQHSRKRPSHSMAARESVDLEQHDRPPIALMDFDGRQCSVSPVPTHASLRAKSPWAAGKSPRANSPLPAATSPVSRIRHIDTYSGSSKHKNRLSTKMSISTPQGNRELKSPSSTSSDSPRSPRSISSPESGSMASGQHSDAHLRDERLAFGIPDSLSFCGSNDNTPDEDEPTRPPWSRLNSTASTTLRAGLKRADSEISEGGWQLHHHKFSKELSRGAAALFETLTSRVARSSSRKSPSLSRHDDIEQGQDKTPVAEPKTWKPRNTLSSMTRSPDFVSGSPEPDRKSERRSLESATEPSCSSLGSVYEEPPGASPTLSVIPENPAAQAGARDVPNSWRSTLPPGVYQHLLMQYKQMEMDRQEVIHELVSFDKDFVKSSRHVIHTYFLPLRTRDSRAWLPGLPSDMARLFDWLEDIVNLHAGVVRALAPIVVAWKEGAIVERIAGTLRTFVSQFEIYMPYLVKLDGARESLRYYVEKDEGEFGEYLRMLKADEDHDSKWALERLVREPSSRLEKYVEYFQRLCSTTPREHPDYLASISLLHSTRMAVRVMNEVKVREEEYNYVKDLASRIDGLSRTVPLARRARRLLWYGVLLHPEPAASGGPDVVSESASSPRHKSNNLRDHQHNHLIRSPAQRGPKLATAVRDWDRRRSPHGSMSSSPSLATSMQTIDTTSSGSSAFELVTPRSDQQLSGFGQVSSSRRMRDVPAPKPSEELRQLLSGNRIPSGRERTRDRMLKVMVFTDVLVLTAAVPGIDGSRSDEERLDRCRLVDNVGISRLLDFTDSGGGLSLNVVPVKPEHLDTGFISDNAKVASVSLSFSSGTSDAERRRLLEALRKCQHHTFRSLSMPTIPGALMEDLEIDTRQSLVGILSSGLPLPKSPSIQFEECQKGLRRDVADGEREERGWWTLRFHQVLRELQREENPFLNLPYACNGNSA